MIRNGDSVFFDWDNDRVIRGGVETTITGQQKRLLRLLVEEKPAVKPKDYLLNGVWGKRAELVDELYLVQLVYRLRKALSPVGLDGHIVTVPREGYRFIPVPNAVLAPIPPARPVRNSSMRAAWRMCWPGWACRPPPSPCRPRRTTSMSMRHRASFPTAG